LREYKAKGLTAASLMFLKAEKTKQKVKREKNVGKITVKICSCIKT